MIAPEIELTARLYYFVRGREIDITRREVSYIFAGPEAPARLRPPPPPILFFFFVFLFCFYSRLNGETFTAFFHLSSSRDARGDGHLPRFVHFRPLPRSPDYLLPLFFSLGGASAAFCVLRCLVDFCKVVLSPIGRVRRANSSEKISGVLRVRSSYASIHEASKNN